MSNEATDVTREEFTGLMGIVDRVLDLVTDISAKQVEQGEQIEKLAHLGLRSATSIKRHAEIIVTLSEQADLNASITADLANLVDDMAHQIDPQHAREAQAIALRAHSLKTDSNKNGRTT